MKIICAWLLGVMMVMVVCGAWMFAAQQKPVSADVLLGQALHQEQNEGRLEDAIASYKKVLAAADATREQKARAQFRIGACYERLGLGEARKAYEAVVANYADQADLAAEAKARLAVLAQPAGRGGGPLVRQIWANSGGVEQGRISPDGRSVVGVDEETGDLLIRSVATGQIRRLTAISKDRWWLDYAESPVWSRDGRQIAYNWEMWAARTVRGAAEFRIADVAGGTSRVVPLDARFRSAAPEDWSPDGRRVLARLEEGPPENRRQHLAWVPTSGGTAQLLASAGAGKDLGPAFLAPDGAWIVTRIPKDDTAFSIMPARGGPPRVLMPAADSDSLVGWSADGTHVLFMSPEDEFNNLMAVRVVDGRAVDRPFLIHRLHACSSLGVSQAGALLCQSTQEPRTHVYRATFDMTSGRVGPPSRVDVSTGHSNGSVSWSPDGRRVAYVSWPEGKPPRMLSIWSAESAQTRSFSLPFDAAGWGWRPTTWSADGRWVYLAGQDDTIYRVDTETGTVEAVVPPSAGVFTSKDPNTVSLLAGWSPDARVVYKNEIYKQPERVQGAIVAHRLADHTERELFRSGGVNSKVSGLDVSPDGSQLAFGVVDFTARTLTVITMPAAGGPAKTFATLATTFDGLPRWTHDGRSFVVVRRGDEPHERLLCDVTTGVVTTLTFASELAEEITVSHDGKQIAYVVGSRPDQGVWMLEYVLPKPRAPTPPAKTRR